MNYVLLVEEKSMKIFLETFLPFKFPECKFRVISHEGKVDLKQSLVREMKVLNWNTPMFIVLIDKDANDCRVLKTEIDNLCCATETNYKIRIVCHELESWYLGDLAAVDIAFSTKLSKHSNKKTFREPDDLPNAKEILKEHIGQIGQNQNSGKNGRGYEKYRT